MYFVGDNTQKQTEVLNITQKLKNGSDYTLNNVVKLKLKYTGIGLTHDVWEKCWRMYEFLWLNHQNEFDWIIRSDMDAWFSTPNFKGYAQYFDPEQSWYFGNPLTHTLRAYAMNVGIHAGGLIALSHGSIKRLNAIFETAEFLHPSRKNAKKCQDKSSWADDVDERDGTHFEKKMFRK